MPSPAARPPRSRLPAVTIVLLACMASRYALGQSGELDTEFATFSTVYRLPEELRFELLKGIAPQVAAGKIPAAKYQCLKNRASPERLKQLSQLSYKANFQDDVDLLKRANDFYATPTGQHLRSWDLENRSGRLKADEDGVKYTMKPAYLFLNDADRAKLPASSQLVAQVAQRVAGFPKDKIPQPDPQVKAEMESELKSAFLGCGFKPVR